MEWDEIEYPSEKSGQERALWWVGLMEAPVFPAGIIGTNKGGWTKQPFLSGWQHRENCASSVQEVVDMWGSRPGWRRSDCGILLNDLLLVDLDTKEGWYDGKLEFKKIVANLGLNLGEVLKDALIYETPGRSGGIHILWKRPDSAGKHKKSVPAAGVEVLGNAHYVLAPCSRRPDKHGLGLEPKRGGMYRLLAAPIGLKLGVPPVELWNKLKRTKGQTGQNGQNGHAGAESGWSSKPSLEMALACSDDGVVLAGLRHDVLYKEAARRAVAGGAEFEVVEWLREILNADPAVLIAPEDFVDEELERMANNAVRWASGTRDGSDVGDGDRNFNLELIIGAAGFVRKVRERQQEEMGQAMEFLRRKCQ